MTPKLLFLIPLLPLLCGALNAAFGMRLPRRAVQALAVAGVAGATLLCLLLWPLSEGGGSLATLYTWLQSGTLTVPVAIRFDALSAPMALMVCAVSTLIHLYAVGYMEHEEDCARFFALLNLFVFAMLSIVLADNLLLLFLGWEGVGFCSYALIGFWYGDINNARAGRKAFLVTRVGDVFFGIALLWLFSLTGTLSIGAINAGAASLAPQTVTALTLLLLAGACGKSAQLPLMTWLPDAMAGPTPVSALIHAATMVTAGVYLLCRLFPLVSLSPTGMAAIALVGAVTALYAATCALAQREIKRVLAYSTMSQVGYMILAVGAGSVASAMFHLYTHAFFKALLFMAAGGVIHLCAGENDIFAMGGLARRSRPLMWLFLAGSLCLAGAPLTGGFFSKDAILLAAFTAPDPVLRIAWALAVLTALVTAFYTFRLFFLVFAGNSRGAEEGHAPGRLMIWPLIPLALLGLAGGLLNLPPFAGGGEWLGHHLGPLAGHHLAVDHALEWSLAGLSAVLVATGLLGAYLRYRRFASTRQGTAARFALQGWHADALVEFAILRPFAFFARFFWKGVDEGTIDGVLETLGRGCAGGGRALARLVTGRVSVYLAAFAWGLLVILGWLLLSLVGHP